MKSHVVIFNRAPLASRDGWIHIVPKGELPNAEAGIVQVLDDSAMDAILAGIEKDKNRLGDRWPGVYAGREHFIYDDTKDSAALAWFKEFKKDVDGLWAKDDGLTPAGTAAVTNREYKFTSFVSDPKQLQKISGTRYRVTGIETIGFTNQANGKELLTPITNRATILADDELSSAANQQQKTKNKMKNIATKLGLAAEASEDAILAEVTKIQNRIVELTPLADDNTKLKNRIAVADAAAVDSLLAAHGVKDQKVLNRLKPVLLGIEKQEDRVATLTDFGFKPGEQKTTATPRVLNRGAGAVTAQEAGDDEAAQKAEQARATKVMNRAKQLMKEVPHLSLATATKMASDEITA
jgi:hypothetical protein